MLQSSVQGALKVNGQGVARDLADRSLTEKKQRQNECEGHTHAGNWVDKVIARHPGILIADAGYAKRISRFIKCGSFVLAIATISVSRL